MILPIPTRRCIHRIAVALTVSFAGPAGVLAQSDPLTEPFEPTWRLSQLQPSRGADGTYGFLVRGTEQDDGVSRAIAPLGDINGDGIGDLFLGSYDARPGGMFEAGWACVLFGRRGVDGQPAFPPLFDISTLDGTNGFFMPGVSAADRSGLAGAAAGDVNGDGVDDAIFGTGGVYPPGRGLSGQAFVLYGRSPALGHEPFPASVVLDDIQPGEGIRFFGTGETEFLGVAVAGIGDFNADGIGDLALGASTTDVGRETAAGALFVLFGRDTAGGASPWPDEIDLALLDGQDGFAILGWRDQQRIGGFLASGDLNNDGHPDVVTMSLATGGGVHVVYGGQDAYPATIDVRDLDGTTGVTFRHTREALARSLSAAGDFDGDGIDDLLVGTSEVSKAYLIFGQGDAPWPALVDIDALPAGATVEIAGAPGSVAGAGGALTQDVNGDRRDDLIIGAPRALLGTIPRVGQTTVLYGRDRAIIPERFDLSGLIASDGTQIAGFAESDESGSPVAGIGDINGDGQGDFAIAARGAFRGGADRVGEVAIVYGRRGCMADFDRDGSLTIFDFLLFFNAFDAGDPTADFDGDGELTLADFLAFCNAFDLGCE